MQESNALEIIQACYDYHLGVAASDTDADPANGTYSVHCEHAAGAAPCVD